MIYRIIAFAALVASAGASALAAGTAPTIVSPSQVHWSAGTGALKGAQVAAIFGAMDKPEAFVVRIRMPDGMKLGPHYHPVLENVTVLQGTLLIGVGDKMDAAKMIALPAGSFFSVPAGVHHYAMAKGDTIIQLNDTGPWGMTAVTTHM
jgi:quercetin dioxygenase-like cupin family protein